MAVKEYTVDAAGKSLGRVASEAAKALMGKNSPEYTPHIRSIVRVKIIHASKLSVSTRKRMTKTYSTYSGFPGGRHVETFAMLSERRGVAEPIRRAVRRMLPRNTFLSARLKQLQIIP